MPFSQKKGLLQSYSDLLVDCHDRIVGSSAVYQGSFTHTCYGNCQGADFSEEYPPTTLLFRAAARKEDSVQQAS